MLVVLAYLTGIFHWVSKEGDGNGGSNYISRYQNGFGCFSLLPGVVERTGSENVCWLLSFWKPRQDS